MAQIDSNKILALSQPVDVYAEWIDACEEVAAEQSAARPPPARIPQAPQQRVSGFSRAGLAPGEKLTEEDRNFIEDDEDDAEAEYAYD